MKILITGPQGSGKTTQANILAKKLDYRLIKLGDLLREFARGNGEENKRVAEWLKNGEMADDEVPARLVKEEFDEYKDEKGVIADGCPRRMSQLERYDPGFDIVFDLVIDDEVGVERLVGRGRSDDTPKGIKKRLSWYHQETEPVLDYYRKKGILVEIDGTKSVDEVTKEILKNLR
jgi:adenylate kinase